MTRRVSHLIRTNNGLSLVGLIVSLGVGTVLTLMVASLLNQIFRSSAKTMAVGDANGAAHLVEQVISNKTFCDNALRDGSGGKIRYNPAIGIDKVPVTRIYMNNKAGLNAIAMEAPARLNPKVKLSNIVLQERISGQGRSTTNINVDPANPNPQFKQYDLFSSELVLNFAPVDSSDLMVGGSIPPVKVPVTVAIEHLGPNTVDYCYQDSIAQQTCNNMGGTLNADGSCSNTLSNTLKTYGNCDGTKTGCVPGSGGSCANVYRIAGFDSTGYPICVCNQVCAQ